MCSSQSEADLASPLPPVRTRRKVSSADYVFEGGDTGKGHSDDENEDIDKFIEAENDTEFVPSENDSTPIPQSKKRGRPRKSEQDKALKKHRKSGTKTNRSLSTEDEVNNNNKRTELEEVINLDECDTDDETTSLQKADINVGPPPRPVSVSSPEDINSNYEMTKITPVKKNSLNKERRVSSNSSHTSSSVCGRQSSLSDAVNLARDSKDEMKMQGPGGSPFHVVATPGQPRLLRPPMTERGRSSTRGPRHHSCPRPGAGARRLLAFPRPSMSIPRSLGSRMPKPRFLGPMSLSQSPYMPMSNTPVVSPSPQSEQFPPASPSLSAINKLSSLGVSIVRSTPPPSSWLPGISISRTWSLPDHGPVMTVSTLATALHQLGEVEGRKRSVRFRLTEEQIKALQSLGVEQERE